MTRFFLLNEPYLWRTQKLHLTMKTMLVVWMAMMCSISVFAQGATNFSVKDCSGQQYTLFDELNAGKVVVLTWTMPCGSCVLPLKTTYNVVQSFQNTYPGMVQMLMADDYANTPCASIDLWANSNGMPNTRRFSNPAIRMLDYGSNGMPKVVVIGGPEKQVFYNANDAVDHVALQAAIQSAISVITSLPASVQRDEIKISFQPSGNSIVAALGSQVNLPLKLDILSILGQKIHSEALLSHNGSTAHFVLPRLEPAAYLAILTNGQQTARLKFIVE